MPRKKSPKGTVSVRSQDGMLRLVWRIDGQRYVLVLGLADTPLHRRVAQGKAAEIQSDIAFDRFDPTLTKYRRTGDTLSSGELFDRFTQTRLKQGLSPKSVSARYRPLSANLGRFGEVATPQQAQQFIDYLRARQSVRIANQNLSLLKGWGDWAVEQHHWKENPFRGILPAKGAKLQREGKPFTRDEIRRFLQAIVDHPHYFHYHDVCLFMFSTGCRPSEAFDLTWGDIDLRRGEVTIRATKTANVRTLLLQPTLRQMLVARAKGQGSDRVFLSPKGARINAHNFSQRCWRKVCEKAGIPYRVPYFARHSLASHLIEEGATFPQTAYVLGHKDTRMVAQTYGRMITVPRLPDFGHDLGTTR